MPRSTRKLLHLAAVVAVLLLLDARPPLRAQEASPADSSSTLLSFQHYEVNLPASEGWSLVSRAAEDEAIRIHIVWQRGDERFTLADLQVERLGVYERSIPRRPEVAFNWLASQEVAEAKASAAGNKSVVWHGSKRDSFADKGRTFHRLWYSLGSASTLGQVWSDYYFPRTFATDGFFIRARLHFWSRQDREDVSIIDEFEETVRSLRERRPELDVRVVPEKLGALDRARLSLPFVYYDARARATHSPHDTTKAPCWVQLEDSVAVGLQATRLPDVTFFSFRPHVPLPGDRSPGERFGKAFDRDGDGRFDLVFFSQGWGKGQDQRDLHTFYTIADDDGDGRVDGLVDEDGDNDRDALIDHSIFVQDRARKGEPDRAWIFDTDIAHPVRPVPHAGPVFDFTRASRPGTERTDLGAEFRDWTRYLGWLNRAAAECRQRAPARR